MIGLDDITYLLPALLAGMGVAGVAGPLGSVMIWRRLAYFGDTLSHAALLGVALALAWHFNVVVGVGMVAIVVAALLFRWQDRALVGNDTLLGLLSYAFLALGLIVLSVVQSIQVDLLGFLYGDILSVTPQEVIGIYLVGVIVLIILKKLWPSLLRLIINKDLATVEGVPVRQVEAAYLGLLAILIAMAIKIVGVLLITALFIIPAAAARVFSKTPEQMAGLASLLGIVSVVGGFVLSYFRDFPTGPTIVVISTVIFLVSMATNKLFR